MAYRVEMTPRAIADTDAATTYLRQHAPTRAPAWFSGLIEAILSLEDTEAADLLRTIQNDLFDLGADLCVPERPKSGRAARARPPLRITVDHVRPLEQTIDRLRAAEAVRGDER